MRLFYLLKILPSDFTISRFQKFFEIFSPICNWQSFVLPACVSFAESTKTNFCAWVNHTRTENLEQRRYTPQRIFKLGAGAFGSLWAVQYSTRWMMPFTQFFLQISKSNFKNKNNHTYVCTLRMYSRNISIFSGQLFYCIWPYTGSLIILSYFNLWKKIKLKL